jgi:hypothetical protein
MIIKFWTAATADEGSHLELSPFREPMVVTRGS